MTTCHCITSQTNPNSFVLSRTETIMLLTCWGYCCKTWLVVGGRCWICFFDSLGVWVFFVVVCLFVCFLMLVTLQDTKFQDVKQT